MDNALPLPQKLPRWWWLWYVLTCLIVLVIYAPSFPGPFIFDDVNNIREAQIIRDFPPRLNWAHPESRPIVLLTFSLNYLVGGDHASGYRITNVLLHLACGFFLAILVHSILQVVAPAKKTEAVPVSREKHARLAALVATLWLLHPVCSSAVAYIVQRAEILASLGMILFLDAIIRDDSAKHKRWQVFSIFVFLLGVFCKTNAIAILPIALVFDRMYLSSSWMELIRKRGVVYAIPVLGGVFAAAKLLPGILRGDAGVGFAAENPSALLYFATQCQVLWHYLAISIWPADLSVDYRWPPFNSLGPAMPWVFLTGSLLSLSVWLCFQRKLIGWLVLSVFLALAPTSSFIPVADVAVDHRFYFSLALLIGAVLCGLQSLSSFSPRQRRWDQRSITVVACFLLLALAGRTMQRANDWRSSFDLWRSAAITVPSNPRALQNLTQAAEEAGREKELLQFLLDLAGSSPEPTPAVASRLGEEMLKRGQLEQARKLLHYAATQLQYFQAVDEKKEFVAAQINLGSLYLQVQNLPAATENLLKAVAVDPTQPYAFAMLGQIEMMRKEPAAAAEYFRKALLLQPQWVEVQRDLSLAEQAVASKNAAAPISVP